MIDGKWTCSTDEENWSSCFEEFDTKQEALDYAQEFAQNEGVEPGLTVYVGQVRKITTAHLAENAASAEVVVENIDEWLYENVGEEIPNQIECTPEQTEDLQRRLNATVEQWLNDNSIEAPCWKVENVQYVLVDEYSADLDDDDGDDKPEEPSPPTA